MTLSPRQLLFTSCALLTAACGAGAGAGGEALAPVQGRPPSQAGRGPAQAAGAGSTAPSVAQAPGAPAGAATEGEDQAYESGAAPETRPGLGTTWGEDRSSRVTQTPFDRQTPSSPFAVATVYYNDNEGVTAMASQSSRSDYGDNVFPIMQSGITVRLLDESGRPLPSTRAGGRTYVVGEAGQRYTLEVSNHTGNRVEAVATVDGLDVIDGQPGSFEKRGYLVAPYATVAIDGFRRSSERVAAFRFGSVAESYAERKGEGRNVGVIGVAFFDEAGARWPWTDDEIRRRHDADPFPGRYAEPPPR
jgi:hypothetical protein